MARPQNKQVATKEMDDLIQYITMEEEQEKQKQQRMMNFSQYLEEKHRIPDSLRDLVIHALALQTSSSTTTTTTSSSSSTTKTCMNELCRHMLALGRFGTTAFLCIMYGSGELSQAFCRSAAVYGATYLLRRTPIQILHKDKHVGKKKDMTSAAVHAIVLEEEEEEREEGEGEEGKKGVVVGNGIDDDEKTPTAIKKEPKKKKMIRCSHVVIPREAIRMQHRRRCVTRVFRRISIIRGKPIFPKIEKKKEEEQQDMNEGGMEEHSSSQPPQQRYVVIIPPGKVGNESVIQGMIFDEGMNVAPHVLQGGCCSVAHLTTTATITKNVVDDDADSKDDEIDDDRHHRILKKALDSILKIRNKKNNNVEKDSDLVEDIFHIAFSYDVMTTTLDEGEDDDTTMNLSNVNGLHMITRPVPSIALDDAFVHASRIFNDICAQTNNKHLEFLKISQRMNTIVQESLGGTNGENNPQQYKPGGDDDDDENLVLESAMSMIQHQEKESSRSNQ